jgi:hypothetical protein
MTDEEILGIFSRNGMRIETGAQFSAKGQIAQLLNGFRSAYEILNKNAVLTSAIHSDGDGQCVCPAGIGICGFGDPDTNICSYRRR